MKLEKIAVPFYQNRVSPLFDLSENIIIVEINDGKKSNQEQLTLELNNSLGRYDRLLDCDLDVIICNAISRLHQEYFCSRKIKVINSIIGDIDDVINAYCENRLSDLCLTINPCRKRRGRCRRKNKD